MSLYLLNHDDWRGYTLIENDRGSARVVGFVEKLRPGDWVLTGPWAPAPEHNLRDADAPTALLLGCERERIDLARIEGKDDASRLLLGDALGYQRMARYDPNAAIAANE